MKVMINTKVLDPGGRSAGVVSSNSSDASGGD